MQMMLMAAAMKGKKKGGAHGRPARGKHKVKARAKKKH